MPPANVFITDIVGDHGTPKVCIKCSCGEETTTVLAEAVLWSSTHIRRVHKSGRYHYKDLTRAIGIDGRSWPVLGSARVTAINRKHIQGR